MKLVFVHTAEKVKKDSVGNLYTDGAYDKSVWSRYLALCDDFVFIARLDNRTYTDKTLKEKFNIIDRKRVKVVMIEDTLNSFCNFFSFKRRLRNRKKISEQIEKADKIIVRMPCAEGSLAVKIAKKYKKDYLIECVGCAWDSLWNYSFKGKVIALPSFIKMKNSIKNSKYVLYVSNVFLQKRYPTRGSSIGCSDVSLGLFDDSAIKKRIARIKSKKGTLAFGTLANISVSYKGHADVIKAVAELKKQGYKCEYVMIGAGDKSRLEELATKYDVLDNVRFVGSVPHSQVTQWLDSIDIYIQPSKLEGMPRALIEAMSRGCPCIGTDVGGIPELLGSEQLYKKGNIEQLVNRIINLTNVDRAAQVAKVNFIKSKEFDNIVLAKRRTIFYKSFLVREGFERDNKFNNLSPDNTLLENKKVLFFITTLAAGGAERSLLNAVRALKDDYEITVLAFLNRGVYVDEIKKLCDYKYIYNIKSDNKLIQRYVFSFLIRWQKLFSPKYLYRKFIQESYDMEIAFLEGIPARILSGSNNENKIAWIHTDLITNNRSIKEYRTFGEEKVCNAKFKKVVGVSSDVTNKLIEKLEIPKASAETIFNILDEDEIIEKSKVHTSINFNKNKFNIISIGRLSKVKGYDRLISAIAKLSTDDRKTLHLYVIGDGNERQALEKLIEKHDLNDTVSLLGFIKNPYPLLKKGDLFVCSSHAEGLSTVVIEAIILGVPILSTDCSGMTDILGKNEYGMIVENTTNGLMKGIRLLLRDSRLRELYRMHAMDRAIYFHKKTRIMELRRRLDYLL